jgi:L-ascorbate metabolism protein UlaG (beta-lactamase superfamily)
VRVIWLGHASVCLETEGVRLLTDPLLRGRVAHLTRRAPPVHLKALGRIDAVLLSHVHRDHLDLPSLRQLPEETPVVAPTGAARLLGGRDTVELMPGEETMIAGVTIKATPAEHEVRRGGWHVPAIGYTIADQTYFAGDTDLFPEMGALAPLELALVPVWGWGPTLGGGAHLDPRRAAEALRLLRPRVAVPIHWGTYFPAHLGRRGHHRLHEPPREFARDAAELAPEVEVRILEPGGALDVEVADA